MCNNCSIPLRVVSEIHDEQVVEIAPHKRWRMRLKAMYMFALAMGRARIKRLAHKSKTGRLKGG